MAVAYDATGAGGSSTSSPITWSHTCTGSNGAVVVVASVKSSAGTASFGAVTYGGTTMTQLATIGMNNAPGTGLVGVYGLLTPATGAQTVSVAASASIINSILGNSMSFTGVGSFGTAVTAFNSTANPSMSATAASTDMIAQVFGAGSNTAATAYNQTQKWNVTGGTANGAVAGIATGTGSSLTFSETLTAASWGGIAVPVVAVATVVVPPRTNINRAAMMRSSLY